MALHDGTSQPDTQRTTPSTSLRIGKGWDVSHCFFLQSSLARRPLFSKSGSGSTTDLCPHQPGYAPRIIGVDATSNRDLECTNVEVCGTCGLKNRWRVPLEQLMSTNGAPNHSSGANPQAQMRLDISQPPPSSIPTPFATQTATTNASSIYIATKRVTATGGEPFTSHQLTTLRPQIFACKCPKKNLAIRLHYNSNSSCHSRRGNLLPWIANSRQRLKYM